MENQHRQIAGYRELQQHEIDLINRIKAMGEELGALVERCAGAPGGAGDPRCRASGAERERFRNAEPQRWAALGRTHFQEGLMALTRAVAVELTQYGRAAARAPARSPTTADLHRTLEARLPNPQWKILRELIDAYPEPMAREALARGADQSASSSGFQNNLGALRSLGFIDYPRPGLVAALPVLFLERG